MKIRHQLLFTHGLLVTLSLIIVLINIVTFRGMDNDAIIINYSGKLRALSYNMGQIANRLNSHESDMDTGELREILGLRVNEFESILLMLGEKRNRDITSESTAARLGKIRDEWEIFFKPLYEDILETGMAGHPVAQINRDIDRFVRGINEMVTLSSEFSREKVIRALAINGALVLVIIIVTVYSFASTNRRIRRPMNTLVKELKELSLIDDEVSEQLRNINTDEISEISRYFNVMIFDQLTKTYNRRSGLARLNKLTRYDRRQLTISFCFLDVNGLKAVNDRLGHKFGDELIISVVEGIKREVRDEDFVIRMGGDEFLIVFNGIGADLAERAWGRINERYNKINERGDRPYLISVSHGIVEYNSSEKPDIEALIKIADDRMYSEKKYIKEELKVKIIRDEI